jgi:hypothetical protein
MYKRENCSSSDCLTVGMCFNSRFLPHTVCTSEQQQLASTVGESAVEIIKRLQRSCCCCCCCCWGAIVGGVYKVLSPLSFRRVRCADGGFAIMLSRVLRLNTQTQSARTQYIPFFRVLLFGLCVFHLKCVMVSKSLGPADSFYMYSKRRWTSDSLNRMTIFRPGRIFLMVQQ